MISPRLDCLPEAQRTVWPALRDLPDHFVLYGGTAIALRIGHRQSIDFDFFSDCPLDGSAKRDLLSRSWLAQALVLQNEADTLCVSLLRAEGPVKVSFFGGLTMGCLEKPERTDDGVLLLASERDLLAHKLKAIHDRAEAKDYIDIAELLGRGLRLEQGLADLLALFGREVPTAVTLKTLTWFKDIEDGTRLTGPLRRILIDAVAGLADTLPPAVLLSCRLAFRPEN